MDFAEGWYAHIRCGVDNSVLYTIMHGREERRHSVSAQTTEAELHCRLVRLADAELLQMDIDAVAVTAAMAIGCVTRLIRDGGRGDGSVSQVMRTVLMSDLTGTSAKGNNVDRAARGVLSGLGAAAGSFTLAEQALPRQWLQTLIDHFSTKFDEANPKSVLPVDREDAPEIVGNRNASAVGLCRTRQPISYVYIQYCRNVQSPPGWRWSPLLRWCGETPAHMQNLFVVSGAATARSALRGWTESTNLKLISIRSVFRRPGYATRIRPK